MVQSGDPGSLNVGWSSSTSKSEVSRCQIGYSSTPRLMKTFAKQWIGLRSEDLQRVPFAKKLANVHMRLHWFANSMR